jgi:hypothetical protein
MNKELERNGPDLAEILSRNLPVGSEEDHESLPVRIVHSISEIWNKILKNINLKRNSHTCLLSLLNKIVDHPPNLLVFIQNFYYINLLHLA